MKFVSSIISALALSTVTVDAAANYAPHEKSFDVAEACEDSGSSTTLFHTGKSEAELTILADQHPNDGFLDWVSTNMGNFDSVYIPTTVDHCVGFAFFWEITADGELHIAAAAHIDNHEGWIAVGFSETKGMRGSDVVYFTTALGDVVDSHIQDLLAKPITDTVQDWTLNDYVLTEDGYLIFEAKRYLVTDDKFDRPIVDDSPTFVEDHKLIGAWGSSTDVTYHGDNRVRTSIQLFPSEDGEVAPGLDYDGFIEQMEARMSGHIDLKLTQFNIPVMETYYHYEEFSFQDMVNSGLFTDHTDEAYIIGYEFIIQPESRNYMHHILMYGHYGDDNDPNELAPIFVWTPGDEYLYFPVGTGVKFGGADSFHSFTMNYHIDNKDLDTGKIDFGSGIRLYLSDQPLSIEIGMMQIGDPFVGLRNTKVGKGINEHVFECPSSCTQKRLSSNKITVIKESLHMHAVGKRIVNEVIRGGETVHQSYIDYWDFDQSGTPAMQQETHQVFRGDVFRTTCYFEGDDSIKFGVGSTDEMCMAFILYYPKSTLANCGVNYSDSQCQTDYKGKTKLDDVSQIGRSFAPAKGATCSEEFTEVALGSFITLKYLSTDTRITVEMRTTRQAWLGFGINPSGTMLDSDAIIGSPSIGVSKYRLEGVKGPSGVTEMDSERQTLNGTSFTQDENGSVMIFTKLLDDGEDMEIPSQGQAVFIYALGRSNTLNEGHIEQGNIILPFGCGGQVGSISSYKTHFQAHGTIAAFIFGFLMPLAVLAPKLRNVLNCKVKNKELWFIIHMTLNSLNYILFIILVSVAINAKISLQSQHFKHPHEVVGVLMLLIMTIQVVGAICRPHPIPEAKEVDHEEEVIIIADAHEDSSAKVKLDSHSAIRAHWERQHLICGIAILAMSMYQLRTGLDLFNGLYEMRGYKRLLRIYYAWAVVVGLILSFVLFTGVKAKFKKA